MMRFWHVLAAETESAIDNAFNILRSRIDRYGVSQPNISRLEASGSILVELPGVKDPERVRELLQGTAKLEFWETYENPEIIGYLDQANSLIAAFKQEELAQKGRYEAQQAEAEGNALQDLVAGRAGYYSRRRIAAGYYPGFNTG